MNETTLNQSAAEEIFRTYRWRDQQFREGACVALLDGEVVAVAPDLDQALRSLGSIEADHERGMVVEVGPLVADVIRASSLSRATNRNSLRDNDLRKS